MNVLNEQSTRFRIAELSIGTLRWQIKGPSIDERVSATWVGYSSLDPMLFLAIDLLTFSLDGYGGWWKVTQDWGISRVDFPGEPELHRLTVKEPKDGKAEFILERSDDYTNANCHKPFRVVGQGFLDIGQFADDLVADCGSLLREFGLVGYHDLWQQDQFPVALFLRLTELRHGGDAYRLGLAHEVARLNQVLDSGEPERC